MALSVLVSQVGYRPEDPKVVVLQGMSGDEPPPSAALTRAKDGGVVAECPVVPTGELWGSAFWTVDFTAIATPGHYVVRLQGGEASDEFLIEDDILLRQTLVPTSVDTLETRVRGKLGWQDCAFDGRGLESHAIVVLGLVDVLAQVAHLDEATHERLRDQLAHGAEYLVACQRDDGSFMNEYYIARDRTTWTLGALACVALARAAELLSSGALLDRAKAAWQWCTANPSAATNRSDLESTRRIFGQYPPWSPPDEPRARDLLLLVRAATELYRNTNDLTYADAAIRLAGTLSEDYQFLEPSAHHGLYGDFRAWPSTHLHQRAWEHVGWDFNCGTVLPDDVSGVVTLVELLPDHPDLPTWRALLHRYAYGYLLPACALNPFGIYPLGDCEGEIRFFGPTWHGFNGMYAQVARTCMLMARHFGDQRFEQVAQQNLQWIAGAHGVSWIAGIGARSVAVWSGIPGSIGNGFSATPQFRLRHLDDHEDAPAFETREDWLVHNGSWLSGLAETSTTPRIKVKVQDAGVPEAAQVTLTLGNDVFEATTNARGVAVFDDLPRLRSGSVEIKAGEHQLQFPVRPVSGASTDLVVDLTEALTAAWTRAQNGDPRLVVANHGRDPATARILLEVASGGTSSETREVPPGDSFVLTLPPDITMSPRPAWVRAMVTGTYTQSATETTLT
jgi:hypothetical protein